MTDPGKILDINISFFRDELTKRLKELTSRTRGGVAELKEIDRNDTRGEKFGDAANLALSSEITVGVLVRRQSELELVITALSRIADGTYGTCLVCGERISPGRLRAIPHTSLCINCQATTESTVRQTTPAHFPLDNHDEPE